MSIPNTYLTEDNSLDLTSINASIRYHVLLLGHDDHDMTELRVFKPKPLVAYADSIDVIVRLCREMYSKVPGIYISVKSRPLNLFDKAPNCWKSAVSNPQTNCGCDRDI